MLLDSAMEQDGFAAALGPASDDVFSAIVATKNMGETGTFTAVWQTKKYKESTAASNSPLCVSWPTQRQQEAQAKALIATTSYLSRGALERV
jgi:hypothetical protein